MASSVKISNANGKIVTIENNDSNMSDITLNGASITKKVDTLANMRTMNELPETVGCSGYHSKNDGAFGSHFYRLKGLKTTETDNGGTIIIVSVGGSDYVYELQYSGAVNVKWFGAVGDFITDDTFAIQAAIDAASEVYSTVYAPSGDYLITGIIVKTGVTLKGESQAATSFLYSGTVTAITIESTKGLPVTNGSPYYGHHHSDFAVVQTGIAKTGRGIWLKHNTRGSLSNITIKSFDRGVNATGACWTNTIKNCWLVLNKYGVYLGVTDNSYLEPDEVGFTSLALSGMNASSIENNELQTNDFGVYAAVYPTLATDVGAADSLTIQNNSIEGGGQAVQFGLRQSNLRIINNYFEANGVGLTVNPVTNSVAGVDPDDIAADIVQRYAGGSTQGGLTIENNHRIATAATHPIVWLDNSGLCSVKRNTHFGNSICIKQRSLDYVVGPYLLEANTGIVTLDSASATRVIGSANKSITSSLLPTIAGSEIIKYSGTGATSYAVKFADGTMVCSGIHTESIAITTSSSLGGFFGTSSAITFQEPFISSPNITFGVSNAFSADIASRTLASFTVRIRTVSSSDASNREVHYTAVGRWKAY